MRRSYLQNEDDIITVAGSGACLCDGLQVWPTGWPFTQFLLHLSVPTFLLYKKVLGLKVLWLGWCLYYYTDVFLDIGAGLFRFHTLKWCVTATPPPYRGSSTHLQLPCLTSLDQRFLNNIKLQDGKHTNQGYPSDAYHTRTIEVHLSPNTNYNNNIQ